MPDVSNTDNIKAYSQISRDTIEAFGDEGDLTRKYLLNPAIFALLGDVRGRAILDAGCGQGYLRAMMPGDTGLFPATLLFSRRRYNV